MNKIKLSIITTLYIFILNFVFNAIIFKSISLFNSIFYLFEAITISMFINIISNIFKNKTRKIITIAFISFITVLFISQYVHFHFYDCFYSIYSLINGGQVFGFIYAIVKIAFENIVGILIILFIFVIFVRLEKFE